MGSEVPECLIHQCNVSPIPRWSNEYLLKYYFSFSLQDDLPSGFAMSIRGDDLQFQLELPSDCPPRGQDFLKAIKTALQMVEEARPVVGTGN